MDQNQGDEEVLDFEDEAVDGTRGGEGGEEDATTGLALSVGTGHLDENGSSEEPVGGRNEEDEAQGEEGQQRVSGGRDHESQDMHVDELSDCGISNPHAELAEAWGMEGMEDEEGGNEMEDAEGLLRRPPHGSEVFVGNISRDVDGETLKRMFSKCGEVVSVSVPPDPSRSSQNKGYAFVTYASKQQADAAVSEFMGAALPDFPDRKIRVAASHSRNRLYCAGIPRGMPKSELVRALKQNTVGVTDVNLVMAKENVGENRGYCFITYYNQACAEKALQALSSPAFSLGSRHLQLEWAEKRRDEAAEPPPSSKVIWVGGLPADGSEDDLRRIFAEYGDIERVAVPAPRGDGRARRFGFVHFADRATAQRAVDDAARQPFELAGTQLEVAIAKAGEGGPRAERASRPEDDARGGGGGGTRGGGGAGAAALGCLRQGFAGQLPHASVNLRTARGGPSSTWREAPQSAPRGGERLREEWRPTSAGYSHARSSWEEEEEEDAGNAFEPRGATRSHAASGSSLIPALMGSIPTLLPLSTPPASYLPEAMLNAAESAGGRGRGRGREDAAPAARRRLPPGPVPLSSNRLPPGGRGPASGPGYGGGGSRVFDDRDAADNTHPPSSRHRDDVPLPPTLPKPAHLPPPPQDWDAEDVRRAPSSEPPPRRRNGLPRPRPRDSSAFSDAPMRSPRMQLQHDGGGDSEDEEYPRYGRGGPRYRPY